MAAEITFLNHYCYQVALYVKQPIVFPSADHDRNFPSDNIYSDYACIHAGNYNVIEVLPYMTLLKYFNIICTL